MRMLDRHDSHRNRGGTRRKLIFRLLWSRHDAFDLMGPIHEIGPGGDLLRRNTCRGGLISMPLTAPDTMAPWVGGPPPVSWIRSRMTARYGFCLLDGRRPREDHSDSCSAYDHPRGILVSGACLFYQTLVAA